ncbi:MAG: hypothetical protein IPP55_17025 [Anaerolineales bacterium]|nr:hypothetical protein [Anaerolineales bacterium]
MLIFFVIVNAAGWRSIQRELFSEDCAGYEIGPAYDQPTSPAVGQDTVQGSGREAGEYPARAIWLGAGEDHWLGIGHIQPHSLIGISILEPESSIEAARIFAKYL